MVETGGDIESSALRMFPLLKKLFRIGGKHLLLAGGCVVSLARRALHDDIDADLFLVGLQSAEEASALLEKLLNVFPKSCKIFRGNHVVSVHTDPGMEIPPVVVRPHLPGSQEQDPAAPAEEPGRIMTCLVTLSISSCCAAMPASTWCLAVRPQTLVATCVMDTPLCLRLRL
jgi:hypothetical protein